MFEYLKQYQKIIVTGPQRSGTTICAKMISHDTGYDYVDEDEIGVSNLRTLKLLLRIGKSFVVQCPALCRHAHEVADDTTAVILMRREEKEIIASQRRIGWGYQARELARYGLDDGIISRVKYQFWDAGQKHQIMNPYEVEYASLSRHPLWLPAERRRRFSLRQTQA